MPTHLQVFALKGFIKSCVTVSQALISTFSTARRRHADTSCRRCRPSSPLGDRLMLSATTQPLSYKVYIVICESANHYYVGFTSQFENRRLSHLRGKGPVFTRKHSAKSFHIVAETISKTEAKRMEREAVLILASLGFIVCGAGWTSNPPPAWRWSS